MLHLLLLLLLLPPHISVRALRLGGHDRVRHDLLVLAAEVHPVARPLEAAQADAHHFKPMEPRDGEPKRLAHPADLPVAPLGQHDAERL